MKEVKKFLKSLNDLIPAGPGQRHNISLNGNHLQVTLMLGDKFQPVLLEDSDLDKPPAELAIAIQKMAGPAKGPKKDKAK